MSPDNFRVRRPAPDGPRQGTGGDTLMSRRRILGVGATVGAGALLAACTSGANSEPRTGGSSLGPGPKRPGESMAPTDASTLTDVKPSTMAPNPEIRLPGVTITNPEASTDEPRDVGADPIRELRSEITINPQDGVFAIDVPEVNGAPEPALYIVTPDHGDSLEFWLPGQTHSQRLVQPKNAGTIAFMAVFPRSTLVRTTANSGGWVMVNNASIDAANNEVDNTVTTNRFANVAGRFHTDNIVVITDITPEGYKVEDFSRTDNYSQAVATKMVPF